MLKMRVMLQRKYCLQRCVDFDLAFLRFVSFRFVAVDRLFLSCFVCLCYLRMLPCLFSFFICFFSFLQHRSKGEIEIGVKNGTYYQGTLYMSRDNYKEGNIGISGLDEDVYIHGLENLNKAIDGGKKKKYKIQH